MSFVIKNKKALDIVDQFLKSLGLEMAEDFSYDANKVISNLRVSFIPQNIWQQMNFDLSIISQQGKLEKSLNIERNY